ncbi:MAG: hypothetical protein ACRC01_12370 [Deefgea sp.]
MPLLLNLPEADPNLARSVETNPLHLREWLIGLPTGNVMEAGRLLLDALSTLNRVKMEAEDRVKLLDEYQNSLEMLTGAFETAYASPGLPMKDSARQAAQLALNLWLEMSLGWKQALMDKVEKKFSFFTSTKMVPLLIQSVLYCFWRVYQVCTRLFQPLPAGLWAEIHQLFRYCVENKFLEERKSDNPKEKSSRSIATIYKQILLMALADPQRFSGPELDKIIEIIEGYASYAHFQPVSKLNSSAGFFLIELDLDRPPQFVGNRSLDHLTGQCLLFDTIELAKKLHKAEQNVELKVPLANDRQKVQMWLELLRRVIRQWSISPQRLYQRIPAEASVEVVLGLPITVLQLNGGIPLAASDRSDSSAVFAALDSLDVQPIPWQVINESPGGYAILARDLPSEQAKPGEIVAIRSASDAGWMVASIRWLQQRHDGATEMGLQVMSAKAQPVLLRPLGQGEAQFQAALLLPSIAALKQSQRVVAVKGCYTPLREFSVIHNSGDESKIRSAKLIEQQMGYDLFEYTID